METGEDVFEAVGERIDMADVQPGDAVARAARAVHGFADWTLGRTPAHEQYITLRRAVDSWRGQCRGQRLQFHPPFRRHLHVQLWRTGRVTQLVVFEAGGDRILAARDP